MSDSPLNFPPSLIEQHISITKRLRKLLPEIEELMKQGLPRQVILNHLNSNGFNLTMGSFADALHRLRKEAKKKENAVGGKRINTSSTAEKSKAVPAALPNSGPKTFTFDVHEEIKF